MAVYRLKDGRYVNEKGQFVDQYGQPLGNTGATATPAEMATAVPAGAAGGQRTAGPTPIPGTSPTTGQANPPGPNTSQPPAGGSTHIGAPIPGTNPVTGQALPKPNPAPTPLPAAGGGPTPSAAPRTYDAKGHASDGSQSTGLDNPWKIGANIGMTYDHDTIAELAAIADNKKAGSISKEEAAWILNTVGFRPDGQPNYEERWAASRKLDRYAQNSGGTSPWWHDPINSPDAETTGKLGGRYANEQEALDNYGWWNTQGNTPNRRGGGNTPPDPTAMPGSNTTDKTAGPPIYPQAKMPGGTVGHSPTPLPPSTIAAYVGGTNIAPPIGDNTPDTIPDPTQMPDLQRRGPITIPPELQVSQDAFWQRYR